ncbi:hypothetical protein F4861DRAFT_389199 [Xylaria intraflava]|nr:hypothetical protein F4861DRAFT_389199 [Xylaria intraflava]
MPINTSLKRGAALAMTAILAAQGMAAPSSKSKVATPRQIAHFGERPAYSADGTKLAFMDQTYGDAFEMDVKTGVVTLLTHYPNAGYLRVQYLNNGDLFLIGARTYDGVDTTRDALQEMWVLKHNSTTPMPLNHKIWEGVAISRLEGSTKIAWANSHDNMPSIPENISVIFTGNVEYDDSGNATLTNIEEMIRAEGPACTLEPQDFYQQDTRLTYTCYNDTLTPQTGSLWSLDLESRESTLFRFVPGQYNEIEGITPDGKYSMVESSLGEAEQDGNNFIDVWRMRNEANSTDFVRITDFGLTPRNGANKGSNPVVSPDGKTMAFQGGHSGDAAGVGYGLYVVDLPKE